MKTPKKKDIRGGINGSWEGFCVPAIGFDPRRGFFDPNKAFKEHSVLCFHGSGLSWNEYHILKVKEMLSKGLSGILYGFSVSHGEEATFFDVAVVSLDTGSQNIGILLFFQHADAQEDLAIEVLRHNYQEAKYRLSFISKRLFETQEALKAHIARELHDEVGQLLTAMKIQLQSMEPLDQKNTQKVTSALQMLDRLMGVIRGITLDLRPAMLDDLGLIPTVRWYLERISRDSGIKMELGSETDDEGLSADIKLTSFRIVQEAITNVVRHSGAKKVSVRFSVKNGWLQIHITDDGKGFDPARAKKEALEGRSFGLIGMQERAKVMGGKVMVSSEIGRGTEIRAELPLVPPDLRT